MPKIETTLEQMRESYDWGGSGDGPYSTYGAFMYAKADAVPGFTGHVGEFALSDVSEVIASVEGYNDSDPWVAVFRLNDGRFACLSAGGDYTGWDCQSGGSAWVAATLDDIVRFGLSDEERRRLGFAIADDPQA